MASPKKTTVPAADGAATTAAALDEVAAKVEAIRKDNAESVQALGAYFGESRWPGIIKRAERNGLKADDISSLAGKMVRTRCEWHPGNAAAALAGAACGFICAIGGAPSEDDVKRYEEARAATILKV